jgi:FAD/FMN-containing dehydrogenase
VSDLVDELRAVVGGAHVLVDADLRAPYETDWTRRFTGTAACVVRPANTDEVAAVVRACAAAGAPMVVQGGNTGLVGGGVPRDGEVLVSLARLNQLDPVDTVAAQVTAGAGVTLEKLQGHARAAGLDFGVDLAARSAATVGGLVATNAGGIRVLRYGSMRAQLAGLEAVLPDGTVVSRLTGLAKDNTGYDLTQLLAGSEGTLAIITRVRLRLVPLLPARAVALVGLAGTDAALALLAAAREGLATLSAAEAFYADGLTLVRDYAKLPAPFAEPYPAYVVLECAGRTDPTDELLEVLAGCDAVGDATVAADAAGRARLWSFRESHTEAISAAGVPVKLDVCVPLAALPDLVAELPAVIAEVAPAARPIIFGHLNEGNLHVNVLGAEGAPTEVTDAVLRLVAAHQGSISSEHGIGRAKVAWLGLSRSPAELTAMRRIKDSVDPAGLLNPGILLPEGSAAGH